MERRIKFFKGIIFVLLAALVLITASVSVVLLSIPDEIQVFSGQGKTISLPFKEVTINVLSETKLVPGGQSVGVTMDVSGVLVVGLEEISDLHGNLVNPGLAAGLQIGDSILSINGIEVNCADDVTDILNQLNGDAVKMKASRKGRTVSLQITPVQTGREGQYKIGVWVREKTAGLGTMTFYDPESHIFGALGHAITDPVTGSILSLKDGLLLQTRVESVVQGKAGKPGELHGIFYEEEEPWGVLIVNSQYGIFGKLDESITNPFFPTPLSIAGQEEVEEGPAWILTTLDGNTMGMYEVEIEKVNRQAKANTKSMVLRVTDRELLNRTGGIIQGMSGSPIIQNDQIVGAVTHVFMNDPQRGYGIFIEWMLQESL